MQLEGRNKRYDEVYDFLVGKLEEELSSDITYHNVAHTTHVIHDVELISSKSNIATHELELLKTAALFHDSGFLYSLEEHEEQSCKIALEYLPDFHYTLEEIDFICRLIRATKLPQSPFDTLSEILCDGDLFYLGGSDYKEQANKLFEEMKQVGKLSDLAVWKDTQISFLSGHRYFTDAAREMRNAGKQVNLLNLLKDL